MYLSEGKELFIGNRQNGERLYRKTFPYPQKMLGIFCLPFGFTPLTEVRLARRYTVLYSRNGSIPRLLRVTNRHSGYDPREPAQRAGLLRGDNRGGLGLSITLFCRRQKR